MSPEETAVLIALLFKRSKQRRARISLMTLRRLSKQPNIRAVYVRRVAEELDSKGLCMIELDVGGFGLLPTSALNGAPSISVKKYMSERINIADARNELMSDAELDEDG